MTRFVDVPSMVRWLAAAGVENTLTGLTEAVREDFSRWQEFEKTPRVASHTPFGVIELMPTTDFQRYGFKYVNGHPSNPARGFQTVTAFGVLAEVHNGYPIFISEMTLLTALRTAATSALAARLLARPDSRVMALIGAGSQAEFQALALRAAVGIDSLRVFDVDARATAKLARNLEPLGFTVVAAATAAEAAAGADVVTTCTADKRNATVLQRGDVVPGMHVNAIGGDCPGKTELDPAILSVGEVFVEFEPQTRHEGEIQNAPETPVTELWRVLAGEAPGRTTPEQVTVFDSVGFAIADFAALRYVYEAVEGTEFAQELHLVADPEDPKDLFGMINALKPIG
ncbi:ornithine cyclodeaminase [Zhihengliuella flava]|uniref:Ornithine cyclodeaminase n=1 Tax=Zhihengliuella flava TaxID=1285193 RepID=A0A931D8Y8_9MICC|nr:ornithine cyclodeaminase [Zhihengliuella flava]MBG6084564.1 ornithine cyclodeaminase [Zhihengliuella flava]